MRIINIKTGSFFALADRLNRKIPGFNKFTIGTNTCCDRDVNNLLDKYPAHLSFTQEEEIEGERQLKLFGVPNNGKFICITVRDSAYLDNQSNSSNLRVDWSYHNYRDGDIQNYVPALVALAEKGYVIFRMGAVVNKKMSVSHKNIIDYAVSDLRNDFMDIYLGAKCEFCISTGTGFDAVPFIFRRPIIYMNHVPLGIIATFSDKFIATTKLHWLKNEKRYMNFKEIFDSGAGYFMRSSEFESSGIDLIETSPEEIIEGVMEMESRIKGEWEDTIQDTELQKKFWEVFQKKEMHGEIKSKISTTFLRRYQYLL
ncbi:MAG: TIGR04372 family glycosyltransferase [Leptospiraceae bacterium]|nr:TIGR04372 family glycosyltransferase [Leptospiraceae bacterium]